MGSSSSCFSGFKRSDHSIEVGDCLAMRMGRPWMSFTNAAPLQKASISFSSMANARPRLCSDLRIVCVTSARSLRALAL